MADILIVGIGNPYRGDDTVGWAVIDRLQPLLGHTIELMKIRGDITDLIDILSQHSTVYLIDACSSNAPAGTWQRTDLHTQQISQDTPQTSTHGFGLSQAISMAINLGTIPTKLILYTINGNQFNMSDECSPQVQNSIAEVQHAILTEEDIQSCMNTAS